MRSLCMDFTRDFGKKYRAGQKEHEGNLWEKGDMLDRCMEEVLDMYAYLKVAQDQRQRALLALRDALNAPASGKDEMITKAVRHLL